MEKILECFHQKLNFFSTEERKTGHIGESFFFLSELLL